MNFRHLLWAASLVLPFGGELLADAPSLENGLYEVRFRLELPHLETFATDREATICIDGRDEPPVPLLSQKDIFSGCRIDDVRRNEAGFGYDILCPGRGAARATAAYATEPGGFRSRIAIVQGAKNMTMTEVQHGRRVGDCGRER